jgi:uncharacterized UPF0160 family protein
MFEKIAVHSGVFHADDVVSVAFIKELYGENIRIERVSQRDAETQGRLAARGYTLIDVGCGEFDHHQPEHKTDEYKYADNGILKSALGLVLDQCVADGKLLAEEVKFLLDKGLYTLQAKDNGQDVKKDSLTDSPFEYIAWLNCDDIYSEDQDEFFLGAVDITQVVVHRMILDARKVVKEHEECIEALQNAKDGIVNFPHYMTNGVKECQRWNEKHTPEERILFITFPDEKGGGYKIRGINKPGKMEVIQSLRFCGLRDEELNEAAGISDGIFVHANGFLGGAGSLESCYKLI